MGKRLEKFPRGLQVRLLPCHSKITERDPIDVTTRKIILNNIKDITNFVKAANSVPCNMDIQSGRYIIDAKSIMGVISMQCKVPMMLCIQTDDKEELAQADLVLSEFYAV